MRPLWANIMELQTYKENMISESNINRENSSPQCRRSISRGGSVTPVPNSRRCSMSPENVPPPPLNHTIELYTEPVVEDDEGSGTGSGGGGSAWAGWETHHVSVSRVPGYGFGIAVSGGRDNPHFASGDPSIAVSDVLKAGPAQDLLQVNDRIMSVNGTSLENVEYATAVQVLRDSGNTVSLVVRRRAAPPTPTPAPVTSTIKLTLTKGKKEDFGIILGCKLFIKELSPKAKEQLNSAGQCLNEGDVITRINNTSCNDTMSLKEARKIIDGCKERLNVVAVRESRVPSNNSSGFNDQTYNNNYGSDVLNSYSGQNLYVAPPSRSTLIGDNTLNSTGLSNGNGGTNGSGGLNGSRSRGPLPLTHDAPSSPHQHIHPPRPPPPRPEDYYSSRRQLYEEDPLSPRNKPASEPRIISFQKDGSVGLRLTGGNQAGIFVSAVQPGSPASLKGLCPGDKILKVNDMDMKGVTREEAVLVLLSLQEQIDLIVQHSPEEYQEISAQHRGDSFHIKCHFHYMEATKGEMTFRSGDVFHVVDTLHNGTVGAWQVFRIGRNNQEVQKGIIPNKARAEELATAQFNANKKELTQGSSESRGSFFRRRRSTHRRSKSLGKEHWDDVVFSDSISKFPAYERVILKHPGFIRPVILFGPIADLAREKLLRDFPDKFTSPQLDNSLDDGKSKNTSGIIRLSGIRAIMERGKHALLDITPNAVDRLNYAQFYPIVVFLKADNKHIIKQLRQGIPKSAHKSSKKLLEYCLRMERVWGHVFTQTIGLNEATATTWYTKLTDLVQRCQSQQLWISENKRSEPLSDDFLFPMCSTNESRLSYASSPESDVEAGGAEARAGPRLLRASSDPSVATAQDNLDRDNLTLNDMVPPPPPYTSGYGDSKYGFSSNGGGSGQAMPSHGQSSNNIPAESDGSPYNRAPLPHSPPQSPQGIYGHVPDLPPRIDRGVKPPGGVLLPGPLPGRNPPTLRHHSQSNRPTAQERLFGTPRNSDTDVGMNSTNGTNERQNGNTNVQGSLDRHRHLNNTNSYDSMSSYDSYAPNGLAATALALANARLGPNAPDDLKVGPRTENNKYDTTPINSPQKRLSGGGGSMDIGSGTNLYNGREGNGNSNAAPGLYGSREGVVGQGMYGGRDVTGSQRVPPPQTRPQLPTSDYTKYSNRNSTGPIEYVGSIGKAAGAGGPALYKPVPPPKPKHYRPPVNENQTPQPHHAKSYSVGNGGMEMVNGRGNNQQSNTNHNMIGNPPGPGLTTNGYNYSGPGRGPWTGGVSHSHSHSHPGTGTVPPYHPAPHSHQQSMYGGNQSQAPPYASPPSHMRGPPQTTSPHVIDLAGSREQRGSAFELYRKPQHLHNLSPTEAMNDSIDNEANATPKTRKKLSKKSSFLKSITFDLFRSKTKKASKHHSFCERDLQNTSNQLYTNTEDYNFVPTVEPSSMGKSRGLFRSNSTCDKKPLKPILKRQTSFCESNRVNEEIQDHCHVQKPSIAIGNMRRRQNSLCEMEMEPKIKPLLRRQNSMIEYGRRGIYDQPYRHFNMITAIDPIYQRKNEMRNEPIYSHHEYLTNNVPKPERTYVTSNEMRFRSNEPIYGTKREVHTVNQTYCPYSSRQELINQQKSISALDSSKSGFVYAENPYATRHEVFHQNRDESIYATKNECCNQRIESPYGYVHKKIVESPYSTREEIRQKINTQNPYATKEEMLKQRLLGESPYSTREEMKGYPNTECIYSTKSEMLKQRMNIDNNYSLKDEMYKQRLLMENPYKTKEEVLLQRMSLENNPCSSPKTINNNLSYNNPIQSQDHNKNNSFINDVIQCNEMKNNAQIVPNIDKSFDNNLNVSNDTTIISNHSDIYKIDCGTANSNGDEQICTCDNISGSIQQSCSSFDNSAESPYVTKQEILSQKAALIASREMKAMTSPQPDDKLEIIKMRNLAKKEKIYQSRKEAIINDLSDSSEPIYVSKRNIKDSIIYEHHPEPKDINLTKNINSNNRSSPYELSDVAHLSRRESLYQTKQEAMMTNKHNQPEIDFNSLRLNQKKTEQEKEAKPPVEKCILKGEPLFQCRLPNKSSFNSEDSKLSHNPYNSATSMETHYESECSMQFDCKPQSTPYTSQDIKDNIPVFKCNNKTGWSDESGNDLQNTTVIAGPLHLDTDALAVGQRGRIGGLEGPCTTWGIFDNEGGILEDRAWGVSLDIPPDAILPGVKQKIYFTVSDPRLSQNVGGPPIDMDKGEALLSPVVMCGPQGLGFARPVTLRLPHCANTLPSLGLTLNATDTEPAPSWDNILLPATTTLNTVAVKVDHF